MNILGEDHEKRIKESDEAKPQIDSIEEIRINVDLSCSKREVAELFESADRANILIFADKNTVELCRQKLSSFNVEGVQVLSDGKKALQNRNIDFVLIDMNYGVPTQTHTNLNLEDIESPSRDFLKFLRECKNQTPIYLIENGIFELNDEEDKD